MGGDLWEDDVDGFDWQEGGEGGGQLGGSVLNSILALFFRGSFLSWWQKRIQEKLSYSLKGLVTGPGKTGELAF